MEVIIVDRIAFSGVKEFEEIYAGYLLGWAYAVSRLAGKSPHRYYAQALDSDVVDGCDCGRSFNIPLSILTRKVNGDILFGLILKPLFVMTR